MAFFQVQFQARIGIEMVFNGPFGMAADDEDFFDAALQGFLDDILDRLRRRLETGAEPGRRDDGFTDFFHNDAPYSNQRDKSNSSPMISLTKP